jgi:hypothetical protein
MVTRYVAVMVCLCFLATLSNFAAAGGPPPCEPPMCAPQPCAPQSCGPQQCGPGFVGGAGTLCGGCLNICTNICGAIIGIPAMVMNGILAPPRARQRSCAPISYCAPQPCQPPVCAQPACAPMPCPPQACGPVKCRPAPVCGSGYPPPVSWNSPGYGPMYR